MTIQENRPRARDLGITIGVLPPGPHNAITDCVLVSQRNSCPFSLLSSTICYSWALRGVFTKRSQYNA